MPRRYASWDPAEKVASPATSLKFCRTPRRVMAMAKARQPRSPTAQYARLWCLIRWRRFASLTATGEHRRTTDAIISSIIIIYRLALFTQNRPLPHCPINFPPRIHRNRAKSFVALCSHLCGIIQREADRDLSGSRDLFGQSLFASAELCAELCTAMSEPTMSFLARTCVAPGDSADGASQIPGLTGSERARALHWLCSGLQHLVPSEWGTLELARALAVDEHHGAPRCGVLAKNYASPPQLALPSRLAFEALLALLEHVPINSWCRELKLDRVHERMLC